MNLPILRLVVGVLFACPCTAAFSQPPNVPESIRVESLLAGLEGYEQSFEAVSWTQEYYIPPNARKKYAHWLRLERSKRYSDRSRHWFMRVEMGHANPPDYVEEFDISTQFSDGEMRIALDDAGKGRGINAEVTGFFEGGASLLSLQGRFVDYGDYMRGRLLSEVMRGGQKRVYLPPTAEEPWPGVRSEGAVQGYTDIEVRLDPEREFMPCVIRPVRHHDGAVAEVIRVIASRRVKGVSVPTRGFRAMKVLQLLGDPEHPVSPEALADFAAARSMVGLESISPPVGEEERRFIDDFLHVREIDPSEHLFEGPLDWTNPSGNLLVPVLLEIHDVRLGERRSLESMFHDLPGAERILSSFTMRWETVAEMLRQMQDWGTSAPEGAK